MTLSLWASSHAGPAVTIADGTRASAGDLIICTRNDHSVEAGEPGRTLANGDLLRIEAVTAGGLVVRRALDADPATGQRRWTDRALPVRRLPGGRAGLRGHRPRGPGPDRAHRPGRDHRDRGPPARLRRADPRHRRQHRLRVHPVPEARRPGPGPAPGPRTGPLRPPGRHTRRPARILQAAGGGAGRAGRRAGPRRPAALGHPDPEPGPGRRRPPGLLARDLGRRDHPRPPAALPGPAHERPAARLPRRTRPPGQMAVAHPARRRTGRPGPRPGPGRRDRRAGPGRRPRHRCRPRRPPPPPPRLPGPAAARPVVRAGPRPRRPRTPRLRRADRRHDGRPQGPHRRARRRAPPALGHRRARPGARSTRWTGWTGSAGPPPSAPGGNCPATTDPADPIGPEPDAAAPDLRAAWHEAFAALGPADGPDVRGMPDGTLLHLRDTYPVETAWAPPFVGDELRQIRAAAWDARLAGLRAAADARAARQHGDHDQAAKKRELAASYQALHEAYRQRETVFAAVMADRVDWEQATRPATAPGRRRRRRTAPPPPRPALLAAAVSRARARHRRPARRAHPHHGQTARGDGPVAHRTWPPGTARSPSGSPTGRARRFRPKIPITATSARRSPPGPGPAGTRSCSRPSPRSPRPRRSSSA